MQRTCCTFEQSPASFGRAAQTEANQGRNEWFSGVLVSLPRDDGSPSAVPEVWHLPESGQ